MKISRPSSKQKDLKLDDFYAARDGKRPPLQWTTFTPPFTDESSGQRTPVTAGDKIVVPAKTLHAEGAVKDRVVYILALPLPLTGDKFLAMHEPNEL